MNFKQFSTSDNQWYDVPYYQHKTATDTLTLPATLYPNDTSITVGVKGNTVQNGTPSPDNPIMPEGCGDITANMLSVYKENYSINTNGVETYNSVAMIYKANVIVSGSTFTLNFGGLSEGDIVRIHAYTGDIWKNQIAAIAITQVPFAFTVAAEVDSIKISIRKTATDVALTDNQYKIPISSADTTTPIYLGEVEATRKIKKLVLTGDETLTSGSVIGQIRTPLTGAINSLGLCTHYIIKTSYSGAFPYFRIANNVLWFELSPDGYETKEEALADFKAYLAQQYAAGTPVTVWYVLATPETAVVNEPLMKIGEYADEVSGITIPTIAGANAVDVLTTLKPSEVTATYRGWHPVQSVHKRENGVWD